MLSHLRWSVSKKCCRVEDQMASLVGTGQDEVLTQENIMLTSTGCDEALVVIGGELIYLCKCRYNQLNPQGEQCTLSPMTFVWSSLSAKRL